MEKQLEQFLKAPMPVKAAAIGGLVVLVTVLNYFVFVSDVEKRITGQIGQQRSLEIKLAEKRDIAQNLNERRRELDQLEQRLSEALSEMPEEANVDELLAQLSDIGRKSGLQISSVEPGKESQTGTFAQIPVKMSVAGSYHEIALFLQEIANMRRIVNVRGIKLASSKQDERMVLDSSFVATTFRFVPASATPVDAKGKKAAGGKVAGGAK